MDWGLVLLFTISIFTSKRLQVSRLAVANDLYFGGSFVSNHQNYSIRRASGITLAFFKSLSRLNLEEECAWQPQAQFLCMGAG